MPDGRFSLTRLRRLNASEVDVDTLPKPLATVVFLHGAGVGDGVIFWIPVWKSLLRDLPPNVEVVLPSGPLLCFDAALKGTAEADSPAVPGWYKVKPPLGETDRRKGVTPSTLQFCGLEAAGRAIAELVCSEASHEQSVVLGGFSQGGAAAMWAALEHRRAAEQLQGLFSLSGYLPQPQGTLPATLACDGVSTPRILLMHGDKDAVIPTAWSQQAFQLLQSKSSRRPCREHDGSGLMMLQYKVCPGLHHRVNREELTFLRLWISDVVAASPSGPAGPSHSRTSTPMSPSKCSSVPTFAAPSSTTNFAITTTSERPRHLRSGRSGRSFRSAL